jgi:anti-sigma factor RsiW
MHCDEARKRLFSPGERTRSPELAAHLEGCAACAALAGRLAEVQQGLREHHTDLVPDPAFSARVVARLPDTTEVLGWAALRLLPAALTLALVCSWYGATSGPGLSDLLLNPDDPQLLTYVALGGEEGGR